MNKWSRNSIYGAGLASLLYLGCGNSVQNKDIKVQENTDLGLADKNLDDFYQPADISLEDRINPIDSRELDYISSDLDYCNSLEINSPEWCENCNTTPVLENAYLRDPKEFYASWEHIYICAEASDPNNNLKRCAYALDSGMYYNDCSECNYVYTCCEGTHIIWTWAEDNCNSQSEPYLITIEIKDDV